MGERAAHRRHALGDAVGAPPLRSRRARNAKLGSPCGNQAARSHCDRPIQDWDRIAQNALEFALTLSTEITAVHVALEDEDRHLQREWARMVEAPVTRAGIVPPKLVVLPSPYRLVALPICDYVLKVEAENPGRQIAVIVPALVERHC